MSSLAIRNDRCPASAAVVWPRGEPAGAGRPTWSSARGGSRPRGNALLFWASEARRAARLLGATLEFVELDGDARLEVRAAHALTLAAIIRRVRPGIVLAPTLVGNQHPDHPRLGRIVRDAARLARYGGLGGLRGRPAHAIGQLLYYAVSQEAEPAGALSVLIDISEPEVPKTPKPH